MAAKDGSGPRPAAQSAKRLKWLESSSSPNLDFACSSAPPSPSANCQLARPLLQLAFVLHSSGQRTLSQRQTTMAAKDGSGPRSAKRHLLKWLETSSKPWLCLLFCAANCQLASVLLQLAFLLHSSGQRIFPRAQTPWQRRTDRAGSRQPRVPNVANLRLSHFYLPPVHLVPSSLTRSPCCRQGSADISHTSLISQYIGPHIFSLHPHIELMYHIPIISPLYPSKNGNFPYIYIYTHIYI